MVLPVPGLTEGSRRQRPEVRPQCRVRRVCGLLNTVEQRGLNWAGPLIRGFFPPINTVISSELWFCMGDSTI